MGTRRRGKLNDNRRNEKRKRNDVIFEILRKDGQESGYRFQEWKGVVIN